jgi:predicted membrane protein
MIFRDHFLTLVIFSVLVALFFGVLNHRDRHSFVISVCKTLAWMVLGSLAFAYLMFWTGH